LILHLDIPQNKSQSLQTLFLTNQNVWNRICNYRCNNYNNIGGYENKHQIIVANEYIVIQLKIFTTTFVNNQFVTNKITNLKLSGVPSATLEIAGARYKTQAAILHIEQNMSSLHEALYMSHYITYLRQENPNWICINDATVTEKRWPKCICYHS
jgi:hypothetical protein